MPKGSLHALLVVATGLALGCQPGDGVPASNDESTLVAVPLPDLTSAEPAVREQLTSAREELERTVDAGASRAETAATYGHLGKLYHAYDLLAPADACYHNARVLDSDDRSWPYLAGLVAQRQGRYDEAWDTLSVALEMAPADAPTLLHLGQVDLARGRLESARSMLERALAAEPRCFAARFGLAEIARSSGDLDTAADLFASILADQPSAVQVHYPLAQVLQRLERTDEAKQHLERVAGREIKVGGRPHCPDPLDLELAQLRKGSAAAMRRGLVLGLAGEQGQELDLLRQAIDNAPDDAAARKRLGELLLQRGDAAAAIEQLSEAARLAPGNPEIHSSLGIAFMRERRPDQAEGYFRRALEIRPDSSHYQLQVALALQQQGLCEEAISLYKSILEREPANPQALLQRASCLNRLGRLTEAAADMGRLLDLHPPDDPAERLRLASTLLSLSEDERALRHFEVVAASTAPAPVRARAHILIGQVQLRKGEAAAASESFRRAIELEPSLADQPQLQQLTPPPAP